MNKNLYETIVGNVNDILKENKEDSLKLKEVQQKIRNYLVECVKSYQTNDYDILAVLLAFNDSSSFIMPDEIKNYYVRCFNSFFKKGDYINNNFSKIVKSKELIDGIYSIGNEDIKNNFESKFYSFFGNEENISSYCDNVILNDKLFDLLINSNNRTIPEKFYNYLSNLNELYMENNDNKYQTPLKLLQEKFGLNNKFQSITMNENINNKINDIQENISNSDSKDVNEIKRLNEMQDKRKDALLNVAASNIGVGAVALENQIESELGKGKLKDIERIEFDTSLLKGILNDNKEQKFSLNKSEFEKFKTRVKIKRLLNNLDFNEELINGLKTLRITSKIDKHDKIASTTKSVMECIMSNIQNKISLKRSINELDNDKDIKIGDLINYRTAKNNSAQKNNEYTDSENNKPQYETIVEKIFKENLNKTK